MASNARLIRVFARSCFALLTGLGLIVCCEHAFSQSRVEDTRGNDLRDNAGRGAYMLDIPSQPLEYALKIFGGATQVPLFYETSLVSGRRSFALHGEFSAQSALRLMLQGTGLSTMSYDSGTFTIVATARADQDAEVKLAKAGVVAFSPYLALIQKSLDLALCRMPVAAADPDELLARLWISPSGTVLRTDLLSSTGSDQRDRVYETALGALAINARPPAAMPQPINLMIMPKKAAGSSACLTLGTDARSATHE